VTRLIIEDPSVPAPALPVDVVSCSVVGRLAVGLDSALGVTHATMIIEDEVPFAFGETFCVYEQIHELLV
jgi:hypothetical protein